MKKLFAAVLMAAILVGVVPAYAAGDISVIVNGAYVMFDQQPVIENDRTLVPIRAVTEQLGATVSWKAETKTTTIHYGDVQLALQEGNSKMSVKRVGASEIKVVGLEVPPKNFNGRLLLPIRPIIEEFGGKVGYDAQTRTVIITMGGELEPNTYKAIIVGE